MEMRDYQPGDEAGCLALLDALGPDCGAERAAFTAKTAHRYFVGEFQGEVVALGGIAAHGRSAELVCCLVKPEFQRKGVGRFLLFYVLKELTRGADVETVRVSAAAAAAGFFERQGFHAARREGERVWLQKRLVVCS